MTASVRELFKRFHFIFDFFFTGIAGTYQLPGKDLSGIRRVDSTLKNYFLLVGHLREGIKSYYWATNIRPRLHRKRRC